MSEIATTALVVLVAFGLLFVTLAIVTGAAEHLYLRICTSLERIARRVVRR